MFVQIEYYNFFDRNMAFLIPTPKFSFKLHFKPDSLFDFYFRSILNKYRCLTYVRFGILKTPFRSKILPPEKESSWALE